MALGARDTEVLREAVLDRVKGNREAHRALYEEAVIGYRKRAVLEIERMLDEARLGKIRHSIHLPIPEDHTEDYDRIIDMLELDQRPSVLLGEQEFSWYMRDEWSWKGAFYASTIGAGYVGEHGDYPAGR